MENPGKYGTSIQASILFLRKYAFCHGEISWLVPIREESWVTLFAMEHGVMVGHMDVMIAGRPV